MRNQTLVSAFAEITGSHVKELFQLSALSISHERSGVARALELSEKAVEDLLRASVPAATNYSKCFSPEVTLQPISFCADAFASSSDMKKMGSTNKIENILKTISMVYISSILFLLNYLICCYCCGFDLFYFYC